MLPIFSFKPYIETIAYACFVTFSKSLNAPVLILPNINCSAALPPRAEHISSKICSVVVILLSSGRYQAAPRDCPLGTIVTFTSGWACSSNHDIVACPASWNAIAFFSLGVMILFFFSRPPMILSTASKKSCFSTFFLLFLAAINAASLHRFAMSAPENPGVCLAKKLTSKFFSSFNGLRWTSKIS